MDPKILEMVKLQIFGDILDTFPGAVKALEDAGGSYGEEVDKRCDYWAELSKEQREKVRECMKHFVHELT